MRVTILMYLVLLDAGSNHDTGPNPDLKYIYIYIYIPTKEIPIYFFQLGYGD